jgi:L-fucose isomerase-like protein
MGKYAGDAPQVARDRYGFDIVDVSYDDFGKRIQGAVADPACLARAEKWTDRYLALPETKLSTDRKFVVNAFVLYGLFKDLMREHDTSLFTIKECMGTVLPLSQTTACLTLALLNDEGPVAFCESDFVVIPPGVLLHHVTRKPVFMHNSTFPHNGLVTCAHCTGPRRMDGARYAPTELVTHYESEFGAAPKVNIPVGQEVTFIDPEYSTGRWVGAKGTVESNPFYDICRSQQDVRIHGRWKKLLSEVRGSHWVMAYGDHLREAGYAARRLGITWKNISEEA